jgi:hypothetical protein
MTFHKFKILNLVFLLVITTVLFSCESNFKEVQKQNFSEFAPTGEADDFNMKYTDSGRLKSILISPKMLDYASVTYPFTEFPKGINVTLFDLNNKKTFVIIHIYDKINNNKNLTIITTRVLTIISVIKIIINN